MKVLLRSDVEGLGKTGDIVEVARGYSRNFLVPRGLAVEASSGIKAQAESMQRKRALKSIEDKADAEDVVTRLEGVVLQISANASDVGKLFGSVGTTEISKALFEQGGMEIDRKDISGDPVKETGIHLFTLHLHPEVEMQISVDVQDNS